MIYAIICKRCNKIYVGETGQRLCENVSYNISVRLKMSRTSQYLYTSTVLTTEGYLMLSSLVSDTVSTLSRLHMESLIIHEFGALHPDGLNVSHSFL